jgi:hypothetical protein
LEQFLIYTVLQLHIPIITGVAGLHAESEVKDTSKPVHRLSERQHNNDGGDKARYRYLHKRQLDPRLQSFAQPQVRLLIDTTLVIFLHYVSSFTTAAVQTSVRFISAPTFYEHIFPV